MIRTARLSPDRAYRYVLVRRWSELETTWATFVMLNPSIADADVDDPTVQRCIKFAQSWGVGGLHIVNLYALVSTDPKGLWLVDDPVGPMNDYYLTYNARAAAEGGMPLVAAWGNNARSDRVDQVRALPGMDVLTALGVTQSGAPKHPLARGLHRIPDDVAPARWP